MKVCIFTECHKSTGRGHLTRCLSLAEEFSSRNIEPSFYLDNKGNETINQVDNRIIPLLWLTDFSLFKGETDGADIIIIDSYLADEKYYQLASATSTISVYFDDYSRIQYPKGVIINGSPGATEKLYSVRSKKTSLLIGPLFQVVKPVFQKISKRNYKPVIKNVLITIGASSDSLLMNSIITIVKENLPCATLHVISDDIIEVKDVKSYSKISALKMNQLMKSCDLAITGAGQTIFEMMITGTSFIALQTVENQKYNAAGINNVCDKIVIRNIKSDLDKKLSNAILYLIPQQKRKELAEKFQLLIDEHGARRIVTEILKKGISDWFSLRKAKENDLMSIFKLSNEPEVRKNSFWPEEISLTNHTEWFNKTIQDRSILFLIAELKDVFTGQIRYRINRNECTVGISVCSEFRGLSIGEKLLNDSISVLKSEYPEVKTVNAWVKPGNTGSNKLFIKAGYKLILECDSENYNSKKYRLSI